MFNFEREKQMKQIKTLIEKGVLKFAKEPKDNPQVLDFPSYTIPLIGDDYPAKTPVMWNAVYEKLGMPIRNIMLVGEPESAEEIFDVLREDQKYFGGGAGVGFKEKSIKMLDELEPLAQAIGAVNFILKTPEGKLRGFNTDGLGYAESLENAFRSNGHELVGKKVVVLGAGGAGNAVAFALAQKGAKVVVSNRTVEKAKDLANKINQFLDLKGEERVRFCGESFVKRELTNADAVVNVSTKGAAGAFERYSALAPAELPATEENIQHNLDEAAAALAIVPNKAIISDIVLGKKLTPLLEEAKKDGFEILDGIPMVINQGVEAFWLLHGEEAAEKGFSKEDIREIMVQAAK